MNKKANLSSFDALSNSEHFRDHASHENGQNGLQKWFSKRTIFSNTYSSFYIHQISIHTAE
jgi:hypothetical protein